MGLDKSIHVLQMGSSVNEIVNMTAIAVIDAQNNAKRGNIINK
jgi:malate dehydrogenase (oxaloacetate-decarboxylating)(NADP+)